MGQTYGNISSTDPMASIFNPAYLGFFSKNQNFGFSYSKVNWLPQLANDLYHKCFSLNFGYSNKNTPITLGIGYHHVYLDLGKLILTNETGAIIGDAESNEKADVLSVSALFDYYFLASFGFSYKFIRSNLALSSDVAGMQDIKASANAFDFGLALKFPLFDIYSKKAGRQIYALPHVTPFLNPGFSYSVTNIGDEISYDQTHSDPLPRMVYTGINLAAGLKYTKTTYPFNIISFGWAREANDVLVDWKGGSFDYLSLFSDINLVDNILFGKQDATIAVNSGWELGIAEIFFLRKGSSLYEEADVDISCNGWSINFMQPIRLLFECVNIKSEGLWFKFLNKVDIELHRSEYQTRGWHPLDDNRFNGVTIKMKNMFTW